MNQLQFYDVYAIVLILISLGLLEFFIDTYGPKSLRNRNDWLLEF